MNRKCLSHIVLLLIGLSACRRDVPPSSSNTGIKGTAGGVYITNEGNFQFGNAGVSYYEEGYTDAITDVFESANNRPLGDVCQSMSFFKNRAYLVVNNSNKIEVVDANTFQSAATISGFKSPRYILPLSNSKAYVTDLYEQAISIVDLSSNKRIGSIPCKGWTEEMAMVYGKVFVTNRESDYLYVVESAQDAITDSMQIGHGANSIVEDKNSKLWVLCSGDPGDTSLSSLHRINPGNHTIELSLTFGASSDAPARLDITAGGDTLYYLNDGVFQMPIVSTELPSTPVVSSEGRNFYGLGIDPHTKNIYVADALDYVQRGRVYVYRPDGTPVKSFLAGIIPGEFYFR